MNNGIFTLPAQTHIESVHLRVSSLEESLKFYRDLLGFNEVRHEGKTALLSASGKASAQVVLTEHPGAKPRSWRTPGLFHTAILYPSRKELARAFKRLYEERYRFQGFSDHGVSEAIYLADPEGNGVELYADRPREQWKFDSNGLAMMTAELNLDNLLAELDSDTREWAGIHPETRIGHIHLQVSDLQKAERFYHGALGFDITQKSYPGALFVAAGGYHHHIGLNIWNSRGSAPAQGDTLGLASLRIRVPEIGFGDTLAKHLSDAGALVENRNGVIRARDDDGIVVEVVVGSQ
ncbi:MAG: VOC family protein [Ignavibacteriae bacterium]|nr:VOC family protein [Ignavibacteriota bacterium]